MLCPFLKPGGLHKRFALGNRLRLLGGLALFFLFSVGCRPPSVLVEVDLDSEISFSGAGVLRVGRLDSDKVRELPVPQGTEKLEFALTASEPGIHDVWVELVDGEVIARGHAKVTFAADQVLETSIRLTIPCSADEQCDDGVFCNGIGLCQEGHCVRSTPCESRVACVEYECSEELRECLPTVDHESCNVGVAQDDPQYCDPSQGCRPGLACVVPNDCEDALNCTGEFDCVNFRCVHLGQPNADDGNQCTSDLCLIGQGVLNIPLDDGEGCTEVEDGICVSGSCAASFCGDGYADPSARGGNPAEECDNGDDNDDNIPGACRTSCKIAFCGDGVKDLYEECDDGNTADDDGCKNDCTDSICGDGVKSTVEACDDADNDDNDYCLTSCEFNVCGDGVVNFDNEDCDDGNNNPNDGCFACTRTTWEISVPFGYGVGQGDPRATPLDVPLVIALDNGGNVYVAEAVTSIIRRFDVKAQKISRVAGDGTFSGGGDGLLATQTDASAITGMAVDGVGNVFYSDSDGNRVRRIDARTGVVSTIAGNGVAGYSGDGELGLLGQLNLPQGVAVDGTGNVYIADAVNARVRRIDAETGVMTTVLGDGTQNLDLRDLPINQERVAVNSPCPEPVYIALDGNQYLMVFDAVNDNLYKLDLYSGKVRRWAGQYASSNSNIGIPAPNADLGGLVNFTTGPDHAVYFSHRSDHSIRRIPAGENYGGSIERIACDNAEPNFVGDNGESAASAECGKVTNLAVGTEGNIVFADAGNMRVRELRYSEIDGEWKITTLFGDERLTGMDIDNFSLAAIDYIFREFPGRVGISLPLNGESPEVFLAIEKQNKILHRLADDGNILGFAGSGQEGYAGDGGPAVEASLSGPVSVALDQFVNVGTSYLVDRGNDVVRRVRPDGTIDTIIGTGYPGDNAPVENDGAQLGTDAELNFPTSVGVDGLGRVWVSDSLNNRIRRWDPETEIITTIIDQSINLPWGMVVVPIQYFAPSEEGSLVIYADRAAHQIRYFVEFKITPQAANFSTFNAALAGTGSPGYEDADVGTLASLEYPRALVPFVGEGCTLCFLVADGFDRVRQLDLTLNLEGFPPSIDAKVTTRLGGVLPDGSGPFENAYMTAPQHLVPIDADGTRWLATDAVNGTLNYIDFSTRTQQIVVGFPEGFESGAISSIPTYSKKVAGAGQLVFDTSVNPPVVYVAEPDHHIIRKISIPDPSAFADWEIEYFAGKLRKPGHQDGTLAEAYFSEPKGLALDSENHILYVAERGNHVVRAIRLDELESPNAVTTVAGSPGQLGFFGDGLPAQEASLNAPSALAYDKGRLYIADTGNNRIRYLDQPSEPGAVLTTILGDGSPASSGTGPIASRFPVDNPIGIHLDRYGNLFVTSRNAVRVINAGDDELADENDSTDLIYGGGARDRYPEPITRCLSGLHTSVDGANLYFFDECQGIMVRLERKLE